MDDKPKNIVEYKKWCKNKLDIDYSTKHQSYYETVSKRIKQDFEISSFWKELITSLREFDGAYYISSNGYDLLTSMTPEILIKPFDSILDKSFRKNITFNKNWPDAPRNGWVMPDNWFSNINDIIRTSFVVKYLDGADFLVNKIKELGKKHSLNFTDYHEAREEGYYAVHMYSKYVFDIPMENWNTKKEEITFEFQITTQLQDVIRKLTHKYYEKRRNINVPKNEKWQWNYATEEFSANYIGHILHYIEGMIMDVRNKQLNKNKND